MQTSFSLVYLNQDELNALQRLVRAMPWWRGSLEDAALVVMASQFRVPVWTFNYRDLAAFDDVELWSPA